MAETLQAELRNTTGTRNSKRLRGNGRIPAVLYGHGQANVDLALPTAAVTNAVRHASRVIDLTGAVTEKAFIREVQWDTLGLNILHMDLTRVSADERIRVEINVELRGDAQGVKDGGVLALLVHSIMIECLVTAIPEKLILRVNDLQMGKSLDASHVELPEGAKLVTDPHTIIAQCTAPTEFEAAPTVGAEGAEPELITRKPSEEETAEE